MGQERIRRTGNRDRTKANNQQLAQSMGTYDDIRDSQISTHPKAHAARRACRREPCQTFFFSTVWNPSASLGGSACVGAGAGEAGAGDATRAGDASPGVAPASLAASRSRQPPPPPGAAPLSIPGRYLFAAGAGLSERGGVAAGPERRQTPSSVAAAERPIERGAGAAAGCGTAWALRSARLRSASSSRCC